MIQLQAIAADPRLLLACGSCGSTKVNVTTSRECDCSPAKTVLWCYECDRETGFTVLPVQK